MNALVQAIEPIDTRRIRLGPLRDASLKQRVADDQKFVRLMRAVQKGDRVAYTNLLQDLVPVLRRLVRRKLGFMQATDREDLVQDVLLSLHAARATYDTSRPFMPWLMSIAHNRMVDRTRRHTTLWANEVLVDEFEDSISNEVSELAEGEYGDPEALRQAVNCLPARQRAAIELVKFRELSLKEAADLSGMTMTALKVSVHRAIRSLRGSLAQPLLARPTRQAK